MSGDTYNDQVAEQLRALKVQAEGLRAVLEGRSPSKASLIGPGFDPTASTYNSTHGEWITAIVNASSRDAERQAQGKAVLAELGVDYRDASGKATLGTTDASGGWSRAMWSAERAPGRDRDNLQGILLTDRKANNYARAERLLVNVEWRDNLPIETQEQPYALALADQIEAVISLRQLTVAEIVEVLNEEVDEDSHAVKADSVRKALRRGMHAVPPRFAVEGKGSTAKWSL